ncbi:MAG: HD-GYP domain-containing protein [Thermodesulfobacteriota bacterium]
MASIQDYLYDSALLTETLAYLADHHRLAVTVTDSDGQLLLQHGNAAAGSVGQFHPFRFASNIGGLTCAAANEDALANAAPHIAFALTVLNSQLEREVELRETSDEMLQLSSQLNFLYKLARKIIGIDDLTRCYEIILSEIAQTIGADHALISTKGRWEEKIQVSYNLTPEQQACLEKRPSLQKAADNTIIFTCEDGASLLYSPIKEKEGHSGYVVFARTKDHRFFSAYEKKFVSIIENIISPTFETLRLYDSLQDLYLNTVKALAAAIDAKDEYTHGHSFRVAKYTIAIGRHLNIDQKQLNDLEIAAYMHDLGKIGISEAILGKPGKLTAEEFCEIRRHPEFTDKILQPIKLPAFIVDAAVQHHERLDGTGYPLGLEGEKISFFARVIAVADVFDALTSKRPYRDALSVEEALRILCDGIDIKFDRNVVLAFLRALNHQEGLGEMLSNINMNLQFAAIQNLNTFLIELTDFIITQDARRPSA